MPAFRQYIMVIIAIFSLVLMPSAANAAFTPLFCTPTGQVGLDTSGKPSQIFYANIADAAAPVGAANGGACEFTGLTYIFSTIICNFVLVLDDVLGKLYCGMQFAIVDITAYLLTLYVAVFGAQILIGTAQLNAREILIRLAKVGLIWTFINQSNWSSAQGWWWGAQPTGGWNGNPGGAPAWTYLAQPTWGISFMFQFFVGLITSGTWWVIRWVLPAAGVTSTDVMPLYAYIDGLVYATVIGPFTNANSKVIGLFAIMSYALPPVFMLAIYWLWSSFKLLASTLISFMLGISAVAFLVSLSPIFLSFMLFQSTFYLFESWLRYMVSFCLQIIVIFAIIGTWVYIQVRFLDFFSDLSSIIFPWEDVTREGGPTASPHVTWVICPYDVSVDAQFIPTPYLTCQNPGFDPIDVPGDASLAILPSEFAMYPDLLYFMVYNLVALTLIAYAFNTLLKQAPHIAKELVGPEQSPALAPGWTSSGLGRVTGNPNRSGQFGRRHNIAGSNFGERLRALGGGSISDIVAKMHDMVSSR